MQLAEELQRQFLERSKPGAQGFANPGSQSWLGILLFPELIDSCKFIFENHDLIDRFVQLFQAFEH